jgi:LysR family glycine cleavage system transcriptional activator
MPCASPELAAAARHNLAEARLLASLARPHDWANWAAAQGVALPDRLVFFESTSLAIEAAIQGTGVVIASPMLVEDDVRGGRLVPLYDRAAVETEDYYWLLLPPGHARPEAVMFCGWLLHEISRERSSD